MSTLVLNRSKLLHNRHIHDRIQPFVRKWLDVEDRPEHITDMLYRFQTMTHDEQGEYYVNPLTDEIFILDDRRTQYIKHHEHGWITANYLKRDK